MILDQSAQGPPAAALLAIESTPEALLREPLDFLFAEHFRHRQMCRILNHLADSPNGETDLVASVDDFIRYDLSLHVIDEEEDLFPLLRRRCLPEDEIERVLGRLSAEHAEDQRLARALRTLFAQALAAQTPLSRLPGAPTTLRRFAEQERAHLAIENAVVLPIARLRLLEADHAALSRRLGARRGVVL